VPNRFRKLPQADRDLDSIWDYIAVDSVGAANRQIDRIGEVFEMLTQDPLAGRERRELRRDLRSFPVGSYLIFYVALADGIEVVRVMNGRQDIGADDVAP
jgi:toxin ParE1/3/4